MSSLSSITPYLTNYKALLAGLVALYLAKQARELAKSQHAICYQLTEKEKKDAIDEGLFPQFMKNQQGLWLHIRRWAVPSGLPTQDDQLAEAKRAGHEIGTDEPLSNGVPPSPRDVDLAALTATYGAKPKAVIFLVHGYGEHIGRYDPIAHFFNKIGVYVTGIDHQGHGRSDGDRAYVQYFDHYLADYLMFIHREQERMEKAWGTRPPCFLLGHSMGGLISYHLAAITSGISLGIDATLQGKFPQSQTSPLSKLGSGLWPWAGVLLSAPALAVDKDIDNPLMRNLARIISFIFPKLTVKYLDISTVSSIPLCVDRYRRDILNHHGGVKARFGVEFVKAIESARTLFPKFKMPFLVMHSLLDRLTDPSGSEQLYQQSPSQDKTFEKITTGKHELFLDVNAAKALALSASWILKHSSS